MGSETVADGPTSTYVLDYGDPGTLLIGDRTVVKVFLLSLGGNGTLMTFVRQADLP